MVYFRSYSLFTILILVINHQAFSNEHELLIESNVSSQNPFVQESILYTLRLWRKSHLQQGYFLNPDIPDAIVLENETSDIKSVTKGGEQYELLEKSYILIPQISGELILPEPVFSSRDFFVKGKGITIHVKPVPKIYPEQGWLIASSVHIEQTWEVSNSLLKIGEPVERTLIINGKGIIGSQLPKLSLTSNDNSAAKSFPIIQNIYDKSDYRVKNNDVYGTRTLKYRYVADKAGSYAIPEATIVWWNRLTEQIEKEVIPGKLISVQSGEVIKNKRKTEILETNKTVSIRENGIVAKFKQLKWEQLSIILLILSTILLFYILETKYKLSNRGFECLKKLYRNLILKSYHSYKARLALATACDQKDCYRVKTVLLEWAKIHYPERSYSTLISLCNISQNKDEISALLAIDGCLYGKSSVNIIDKKVRKQLIQLIRKPSKVITFRHKSVQLPKMWHL